MRSLSRMVLAMLVGLGLAGCGGGGATLLPPPGTVDGSRIVVALEPDAILAAGAEAVRSGEIPSLMQVAVNGTGLAPVASVTVDLSAVGGATDFPLHDDGSHGDSAAGDGIWTGRIASTASLPALVELVVRVRLADGATGEKTHATRLVVWDREDVFRARNGAGALVDVRALNGTDVSVNATGTVVLAYQTDASELALLTLPAGANEWIHEPVDPFVATGVTPSLAVGTDERPVLAWRHESQDELRLARNAGSGWPRLAPDFLLTSAPGGQSPRVGLDGSDRIVCAWWSGNRILVAREATGFTVEEVGTVPTSGAGSVALAVWPSGAFLVAWSRTDLEAVRARRHDGTAWGAVETVEDSLSGFGLSAAAHPDGRVFLAYTAQPLDPAVVRLATRAADGDWGRSDVLADTTGAGVSAVAIDGAGRPHVFVAHRQMTSPVSFVMALYHAVASDTGWAYTRVQATAVPPARMGFCFDERGFPHCSFQSNVAAPYTVVHGTWR